MGERGERQLERPHEVDAARPELVLSVGLTVRGQSVGGCASIDVDRDGSAAVNELIAAVGNALDGCP